MSKPGRPKGVKTFRLNGNKYNNQKTTIDGHTFDSKKEAQRYVQLRELEKSGRIKQLKLQEDFILQPKFKDQNGKTVREIKYRADFVYLDSITNQWIIEDVKSEATRKDKVYRMKKKMMAYKGWIIKEV